MDDDDFVSALEDLVGSGRGCETCLYFHYLHTTYPCRGCSEIEGHKAHSYWTSKLAPKGLGSSKKVPVGES